MKLLAKSSATHYFANFPLANKLVKAKEAARFRLQHIKTLMMKN